MDPKRDINFSNIVSLHIDDVYNFVFRLAGNKEDAEDITQDTFIKAWNKVGLFNEKREWKPWLFSIARNTALDLFRKKKSISFSVMDGEAVEASDAYLRDIEPLPDEVVARAEEKEMLQGALLKLPVLYREVLLLSFQDEFTFDEIAHITGDSLNTVKSRHRRALGQLRTMLMHPNR